MRNVGRLAVGILELARTQGVKQADIWIESAEKVTYHSDPLRILHQTRRDAVAALRVADGLRVGAAQTNQITESAIQSLVDQAKQSALRTADGPGLILNNTSVDPISNEQEIDLTSWVTSIPEDLEVRPIVRLDGITTSVAFGNSSGVLSTFKKSHFQLAVESRGSGERCRRLWTATSLSDLPSFSTAVDETRRWLGHSKIRNLQLPSSITFVLTSHAAGRFLETVSAMFSGELRDQSSLHLGESVAIDQLNITDDPTDFSSPGGVPFDGEGTPTRRLNVIQNGVFANRMQNLESARFFQTVSTGHARRTLPTVPTIGAHQWRMSPGNAAPDSLWCQLPMGLLVTDLDEITLDAGSGRISMPVDAIVVQGGVLEGRAGGIVAEGIVQDWLKAISGMGNDVSQSGRFLAPTLRIENVTIRGGQAPS